MRKLTQVQVLAKELAKRPLTGKQIENELGIMNYKGRICDLRYLLLDSLHFTGILTRMVCKKTRWGKSRIAVYKVENQKIFKRFLKELLS